MEELNNTQNHIPDSLQHIMIDIIAQNPQSHMSVIHKKSLLEFLFIQFLPQELKLHLLTFLPIKDWDSFFNVSIEWRQLVTTAAKFHLNTDTCTQNQLSEMLIYDSDFWMKKLLSRIDMNYSGRELSPMRAQQINYLRQLKNEVSLLSLPLAKLLYCENRLKTILKTIDKELKENEGSHIFFRNHRDNKLYKHVEYFIRWELLTFSSSSWFEKLKYCINLCPDHTVAKLFFDAYAEIKSIDVSVYRPSAGILVKKGHG